MSRRTLGVWGERFARLVVRIRGMTVIGSNVRCRAGELDFILLDGGELVFLEVRTIASDRLDFALDAIPYTKRRQVVRVARQWLIGPEAAPHRGRLVRFDAMVLDVRRLRIEYVEDAFTVDDEGAFLY